MYSPKQLIIDLAEYQELTKRNEVTGTNVTSEELLIAVTQLVGLAIQEPNMVRRPPLDGILLNTPVGKFNVKLLYIPATNIAGNNQIQSFQITKLE